MNYFRLAIYNVSDFIKGDDLPRGEKEPLTLVMDESIGAPRLKQSTDANKMYGKYWYRSGINESMVSQLKEIAENSSSLIPHAPNDIFLDIACNDGTLLRYAPKDMIKIGIDPADDTYVMQSSQIADLIIQDFFSADIFKKSKFGEKKAKIITTIAMFYDLDNPLAFLRDINEILDDEGLFILQMSYTPLMFKAISF